MKEVFRRCCGLLALAMVAGSIMAASPAVATSHAFGKTITLTIKNRAWNSIYCAFPNIRVSSHRLGFQTGDFSADVVRVANGDQVTVRATGFGSALDVKLRFVLEPQVWYPGAVDIHGYFRPGRKESDVVAQGLGSVVAAVTDSQMSKHELQATIVVSNNPQERFSLKHVTNDPQEKVGWNLGRDLMQKNRRHNSD